MTKAIYEQTDNVRLIALSRRWSNSMARAGLTLAAAAVIIAVSTAGMLRGDDPWATWFYPLAWYPTLLAADATLRLRTGRWYLFCDGLFLANLLLWSIPFWLFFELVNFRLANWYYVFLPADAPPPSVQQDGEQQPQSVLLTWDEPDLAGVGYWHRETERQRERERVTLTHTHTEAHRPCARRCRSWST